MSKQQLVSQTEKRTSYPRKKVETLKSVEDLALKYDTIIVTKLFKVRAGQIDAAQEKLQKRAGNDGREKQDRFSRSQECGD